MDGLKGSGIVAPRERANGCPANVDNVRPQGLLESLHETSILQIRSSPEQANRLELNGIGRIRESTRERLNRIDCTVLLVPGEQGRSNVG